MRSSPAQGRSVHDFAACPIREVFGDVAYVVASGAERLLTTIDRRTCEGR